jgi:HTH-type transcriptional regulator, transcriptional repressor of NAD biosynthesis genes
VSAYRHALVVGKFAPLHLGHQGLIDRAQRLANEVTIVVWSNPDYADMPNEVRAAWVRDLYPNAHVLIGDDGPLNSEPDDVQRAYTADLLARHHRHPDVAVTCESYGPGLAAHLNIAHERVSDDRFFNDLSGTIVRADIHAHRSMMPPLVYGHFVEKVVLLGAESTGKSTLAARLAEVFETQHVHEYGREHYELRDGELDLDDYVVIAREHRRREDKAALRSNRYLFADTNAVTTMFFSHYYNRNSLPELQALADDCAARYRHVIVCNDDIPFEQDGWRDNEVWRSRMQGMVLHDLAVRRIPFHVVSGTLDERVEQVRSILDGSTADGPKPITSLGPRRAEPT